MAPANPLHPWLQGPWRTLETHVASGRVPQALLIHGPAGLGKRRLAEVFAQRLLCGAGSEFPCGDCAGCRLFLAGTHPDLIRVEPPEPGKAIGVDAIRQLIGHLALKSQYAGFRLVLLAPAQQMNLSAANALLKTLEEPAAGTVLLLLTETPAALPATILSRCQKLPVPPPDPETARRWLEAESPGCASGILLAAAGGSPLKALALAATDVVARRGRVFDECLELLAGRREPVALAERWLGEAHEELIDWMLSFTADLIRLASAPEAVALNNPDLRERLRPLAGRLDLSGLFDHWSLLLQSRRALAGPANRQLLLEEVLIRWSHLARHP